MSCGNVVLRTIFTFVNDAQRYLVCLDDFDLFVYDAGFGWHAWRFGLSAIEAPPYDVTSLLRILTFFGAGVTISE